MRKIKLYRTVRELTQEELGLRAGVSRVTINNIENGKCSPQRRTAESLASVLGVDKSDLFDTSGRAK